MKGYSLTKGSIGKSLLFFLLPVLASALIQQLYSIIDLVFVGKFCGKEATAAIGASGLIITCLIGFFNGMAVGTNVIVSHIYGEEDKDKLKKVIHTVFIAGTVGGCVLTIIGILLTPTFLIWMNTPKSIMYLAVRYLRIYMLSMISIVLYNLCAGILRAIGDSKSPMIFQIIGGVINIFADLILIVYFRMGVEGAAIATFLSQTIALILNVLYIYKYNPKINISYNFKYFDKNLFNKILIIGIPSGIQSIVITLSNIIIQSQINDFGVDTIAAFTVYFKIEMIIYLPIIALGQSLVSFVGQNYGAKKYDRIDKGIKFSIFYGVIVTILISIAIMLSSDFFVGIFTSNKDVIYLGSQIIKTSFPFYFLYTILECLSSLIRGKGKSIPPMIIILTSFCGVRILLLIYMLSKWNNVRSIVITYPISWFVAVILTICYVKKYSVKK